MSSATLLKNYEKKIFDLENEIKIIKNKIKCKCKSKYPKNILRKFNISLKSNYVFKEGNLLKIKIDSEKCILKTNDRYNRRTVTVQSEGEPHEVGGYQEHEYNLHLLEHELDCHEIFFKNQHSLRENKLIEIDIIDKEYYSKEHKKPWHKYEHRHAYYINKINVEDEYLICHIDHIKTFHNKNVSNNNIHSLAEHKKNQKKNDFIHNTEEDIIISFNKYVGSPQGPGCAISYYGSFAVATAIIAVAEAAAACVGDEETLVSEVLIDGLTVAMRKIIIDVIFATINLKLPSIDGISNPIGNGTSIAQYAAGSSGSNFLGNLIATTVENIIDFLLDHQIIQSTVPGYVIKGGVESLCDFILAVLAPGANLPPFIASKLCLLSELCWIRDFNERLDQNWLVSSLIRNNWGDTYCGNDCHTIYNP